MDEFERDLEFYTALNYQCRREATPDILSPARLAYQNYMSRVYNIGPQELDRMSAASHYRNELEQIVEKEDNS